MLPFQLRRLLNVTQEKFARSSDISAAGRSSRTANRQLVSETIIY